MESTRIILMAVMVVWARSCCCHSSTVQQKRPPNIVLFIADDLGIGDVGCFGNTTLRTPNIDRIAAEGARLTHHLAAASVCTPSRAALLTGRYPIRMGMAPTWIVRVHVFASSAGGLPPEEITFAELLAERGYQNALIGKWHLGESSGNNDHCHHPLKQGFHHYYGLPQGNFMDFRGDGSVFVRYFGPHLDMVLMTFLIGSLGLIYICARVGLINKTTASVCMCVAILVWAPCYLLPRSIKGLNGLLMRNFEVVEQPIRLHMNLTQRLVREGVEFLEERHKDEQPFLLVMSWVQVHTALHASKAFQGRSKHGPYGDEVEEMDWSTGQILNALDRLGMSDNTFVYFTSDNGGHLEETGPEGNREGGHNGIYKGGKAMGAMEGGIRMPTVVRWPGHIKPNSVFHQPTSLMDVLPTLADIAGVSHPTDKLVDGRSLVPLVTGLDTDPPHRFLFHYCGDRIHGARYVQDVDHVWKVHFAGPIFLPGTHQCDFICMCTDSATQHFDPPLMYNIVADPSENTPISPDSPQYEAALEKILHARHKHQLSVEDHVDQFALHRMLPLPWQQPCCNFPFCNCQDDSHLIRPP